MDETQLKLLFYLFIEDIQEDEIFITDDGSEYLFEFEPMSVFDFIDKYNQDDGFRQFIDYYADTKYPN